MLQYRVPNVNDVCYIIADNILLLKNENIIVKCVIKSEL